MAKGITVLSEIVGRALLAAKLGLQYSGDRDVYQALGYPASPTAKNDYYPRYTRQDIAKAIIDRPVSATWKGSLEVIEVDKTKADEKTKFEKTFEELENALKLKQKFRRLDRLSSIGRYGVLLFGFDDVTDSSEFIQPVTPGNRRLLYIKPFSEITAQIEKYVEDTNDERYGLPNIYKLVISDATGKSTEIRVHHSRVLHITVDLFDSEFLGQPVLESVLNRLIDLEKLVGGSAEMFWRGARPGYTGKVDKDYQISAEQIEKLMAQMDEYEHNLRRLLISEGVDLESLAVQVVDPAPHVDVQIQMISAITGIPKRILTGSERGELASSQDRENWFDLIKSRREEFAEPEIVRPFIEKCVKYGILPEPSDYVIQWEDLSTPSDKDKAEVGKIRASSLKEYTTNALSQIIVPPEVFFELFLGLSPDQIDVVQKAAEQAMAEEQALEGEGEDEAGGNNPGQTGE